MYDIGEASVVNGDATVTFSGGADLVDGQVRAGDTFWFGNAPGLVASITDATHLELAAAWGGSSAGPAAYAIVLTSSEDRVSDALEKQIAILDDLAGKIPTSLLPTVAAGDVGKVLAATDVNQYGLYDIVFSYDLQAALAGAQTAFADVASAATCDIGAVAAPWVRITGTTTITSFGTAQLRIRRLLFAASLTLTAGASLILPDAGHNIVTAAGDTAVAISDASGVWRVVSYQRANGAPVNYETGIWTPNLTFATPGNLNVVYSNHKGRYTKVGQHLSYSFVLQTSTFTHSTASGNLTITGLPYASVNDSAYGSYAALGFQGITKANYTSYLGAVLSNTSSIIPIGCGSGQTAAIPSPTDLPSGGTVILAGAGHYTMNAA